MSHLGDKRYPVFFPYLIMLPFTILLEIYGQVILRNPNATSIAAIVIYIGFIIYFSFRAGIRGGLSAVLITIAYYFYIIFTRQLIGEQLRSSLNTTVVLSFLYMMIAIVIGWLKQTIDAVMEKEINSKKRLLTILRQLPVGVIITDTSGKVLEVNNHVEDILGTDLKPGSMISQDGPAVENSVGRGLARGNQSPMMMAINRGKVIKDKQYTIEKPSGKKSTVLVTTAPIFNSNEKIVAGVSILQDITLMKELEQRKDDFVNIASHEFKTPITSLILYLEILKKRLNKTEYQKAGPSIRALEKQVKNLLDLTNDLLDVSRMQTGKITFEKEAFWLDQLAEEVSEALSDSKSEQKIKLVKKNKIKIYADKKRIYQVLANLITNAKKYSAGKGDINIAVQNTGQNVQISVQDEGMGIKKDLQKKVFDKLYQVSDNKGETFPGFGMGLYIAKEIIKRHKGKIWVESEEGKGSTFYITLPR